MRNLKTNCLLMLLPLLVGCEGGYEATGCLFGFGPDCAAGPPPPGPAPEPAALVEVNLATGRQVILSSDSVGSGPSFEQLRGVYLDPQRDRVLIWDRGSRLLAVDPTSGDREILVDSGSTFYPWDHLDWHPLRQIAYIVSNGELIALDVQDSSWSVIASTQELGSPYVYPQAFGISGSGEWGFVLERDDCVEGGEDCASVWRVHLATGAASLVSGAGVGRGPDLDFGWRASNTLTVHPSGNQAWVTSSGTWWGGTLYGVDLVSGERSKVVELGGIFSGTAIAPDLANDRILAIESRGSTTSHHLVSIDLTSRVPTSLLELHMFSPAHMALDPPANRLLLVTQGTYGLGG